MNRNQTNKAAPNRWTTLSSAAALLGALWISGCGESHHDHDGHDHSSSSGGNKTRIVNAGSSSMVTPAQAWADAYADMEPDVSVKVQGVGSGRGIAALIDGSCDIANASRQFKEPELAAFKAKHPGKEPKEFVVGYEALTILVHKDNPLNEISVEELQQLYMEDGKISKWSELGVSNAPGGKGDGIICVGRETNSGTYEYFHDSISTGQFEMRSGMEVRTSAKDLMEFIGSTPNAIGYARMGVFTSQVKHLKMSGKKGEKAIPSPATAPIDKNYPLAQAMYMFTAGDPASHVKKYLDWITSDSGQRIVARVGFVPLAKP